MKSKSPPYFLWPSGTSHSAFSGFIGRSSTSEIEEHLAKLFPDGYPVLYSSARAALVGALLVRNMARKDMIGVFPWASHCVQDAVSRVATPSRETDPENSMRLLYHQWGYVQQQHCTKPLIEDCADTLCVPGASLFPLGGDFELWSIPKILGTTSGGVLWCRSEKEAEKARTLRDSRAGRSFFLWMLRLAGKASRILHLLWQGAEAEYGCVSSTQAGEIRKAMARWDEVVLDRQEKLALVQHIAADCANLSPKRLPPVIPVICRPDSFDLQAMGISTGYRQFVLYGNNGSGSIPVIPLPIHQDVSKTWLSQASGILQGALV